MKSYLRKLQHKAEDTNWGFLVLRTERDLGQEGMGEARTKVRHRVSATTLREDGLKSTPSQRDGEVSGGKSRCFAGCIRLNMYKCKNFREERISERIQKSNKWLAQTSEKKAGSLGQNNVGSELNPVKHLFMG